MFKFPDNFLWGAATSAYQVEGNNSNSDWWEWEKENCLKEASGDACRSYELYEEDFSLAKSLSHNAHRLSLEWARIEPQEGRFSDKEISHYKEVISSLKKHGLEPIVTLHHFTNPIWFARCGGWHNKKAPNYFSRYVSRITEELSGQVRFWVTINEPMVYLYHSYLIGAWPPQERSFIKANKVLKNMISAHIMAYRMIHELYNKKNLDSPMVSIAKNMQVFEPCRPSLLNKAGVYLRNNIYNLYILRKIIDAGAMDYIGVNYYTRGLVDIDAWNARGLILDCCRHKHSDLKKNCLGWDIYPEGIYKLIKMLGKFNLPILILENGVCTEDDDLRWEFIYKHVQRVAQAMKEGSLVLGYIYWSLIDNYEWDKGYSPRFGLIGVNYQDYARTIRESARRFSEISKTNTVE